MSAIADYGLCKAVYTCKGRMCMYYLYLGVLSSLGDFEEQAGI